MTWDQGAKRTLLGSVNTPEVQGASHCNDLKGKDTEGKKTTRGSESESVFYPYVTAALESAWDWCLFHQG